jgi:hypothetical protein
VHLQYVLCQCPHSHRKWLELTIASLNTTQVLLDRLGCGVVGAPDLLAAAQTAVHYHAGICPKSRVDVNDVLLQLVLQLKQDAYEQQQFRQGRTSGMHKHSVVSLVSAAVWCCFQRAQHMYVHVPWRDGFIIIDPGHKISTVATSTSITVTRMVV